jgi:hypothetical protein
VLCVEFICHTHTIINVVSSSCVGRRGATNAIMKHLYGTGSHVNAVTSVGFFTVALKVEKSFPSLCSSSHLLLC